MGARHLIELGVRSFGYCGFVGELWATRRRDGFLETLALAGHAGRVYESPWNVLGAPPWEDEQGRIGDWLTALPKPVGIMACNDVRGLHVLDACQRSALKVPEEVAVVGVDDDALLCELCDPPLSSIVPNTEQIGFEAGALLDRLMAGGRADSEERLIPPLGVTARLSTDVLTVDDAHFTAAVRFIRENACRGITVDDVLAHLPLSRSTLERRFRKYLGRSPQAAIRAAQFGRAKQLLVETDHALHRIAELVGYEHPEYFNVAFKREFGRTPGQFREGRRPTSPRPGGHRGASGPARGTDDPGGSVGIGDAG